MLLLLFVVVSLHGAGYAGGGPGLGGVRPWRRSWPMRPVSSFPFAMYVNPFFAQCQWPGSMRAAVRSVNYVKGL